MHPNKIENSIRAANSSTADIFIKFHSFSSTLFTFIHSHPYFESFKVGLEKRRRINFQENLTKTLVGVGRVAPGKGV